MREEIVDQIVELERKIAVLPEGSVSKKTNKKDHPQSGQPSPLQMVFLILSSLYTDHHPGQYRQSANRHDESDAPSAGFRQEELRSVRVYSDMTMTGRGST